MHRTPRSVLPAASLLLAAAAPFALGLAQDGPCCFSNAQPETPALSIEEFRKHHAQIREHLGHVDEMSIRLAAQSPDQQRESMRFIAAFFRDHIAPHAADEEKNLYPAVDAAARGEGDPFTATMRYEHRVIERMIDDVAALASADKPDASAFTRAAQRLLGLLEAHFGAEEEVLLPVLERTRAGAPR